MLFNVPRIPFNPSDTPLTSTNVAEQPVCSCFANCLQALEVLHNHSYSTTSVQSIDTAVTINGRL